MGKAAGSMLASGMAVRCAALQVPVIDVMFAIGTDLH